MTISNHNDGDDPDNPTSGTDAANPQPKESTALRRILGEKFTIFFDQIWQNACSIYRPLDAADGIQATNPFDDLLNNRFRVLVDLLSQARYHDEVLFFHDQMLIGSNHKPNDLSTTNNDGTSPDFTSSSLFAAFLQGHSVVINHADFVSPTIAALCEDLQESFPHVYANTYLTPSQSQTVPPHADDRDVLIVQVYGAKDWKVYQTIPIPYPYPHEQVGKDNNNSGIPREIPSHVLEGPCWNVRLEPGCVLYMPRGYVHEASSSADQPSFHITLALATHDWTTAGFLQATASRLWFQPPSAQPSADMNTDDTDNKDRHILRKAVPRHWGRSPSANKNENEERELIQEEMNGILEKLRELWTVENLEHHVGEKYRHHNERADLVRRPLIEESSKSAPSIAVVGMSAAEDVHWDTTFRVATASEKASVQIPGSSPGLRVRESDHNAIVSLLQALRQNGSQRIYRVSELPQYMESLESELGVPMGCSTNHLLLVCFVRQCVELGALAIVRVSQ